MEIVSWNLKGLNSKVTLHSLKIKINKVKLDVMILQETKMESGKMTEVLQKCWKGSEAMSIDSKGKTRGNDII